MSSHGADLLSYAVFLLFPVMLCCIKEEAKDDSLATAQTTGRHASVFVFSFFLFFFFEGEGMKNRKTRKVVRAPDADEEKKKKQTPRFLLPHHCYAWHKGLLRNERGKHNNRAVNARRNKRCAADVEETHSSESDANTKKKKEKRNPKKKKRA